MSLHDAHAFMALARSNRALQSEISLLRGADTLKKLAALAESRGFHFSEEEYRKAATEYAAGELSESAIQETAQKMGLPEEE